MRSFDQSPSIVPPANDQDVYLVLDDFRDWQVQVWRETDVEDTDLETLIEDLLDGQYSNPVRIVAFNTAEGWSRDVSKEVAQMLLQRCAEQVSNLPSSLEIRRVQSSVNLRQKAFNLITFVRAWTFLQPVQQLLLSRKQFCGRGHLLTSPGFWFSL